MTDKQDGQEKAQLSEAEIFKSIKPHSSIAVDYEAYAHFLEDADLSEAQKQELMQALWNIVLGFISLGFGVHPLQQAENSLCGQSKESGKIASADVQNALHYRHQTQLKGSKTLTAQFQSADQSGVAHAKS